MTVKDPYRYFRVEARELVEGLVTGVLELEKGAAGPDAIARVLRLAHTLKGAARVVKQTAIAELAHAMEEELEPHRGGSAPDKARIDALLKMIDRASAALALLDCGGGEQARAPAEVRPLDTVRIELAEMDALQRGVAEVGVQLTALRRRASRQGEALQRSLGGSIDQVERELLQVRDTADKLRLLPTSVLFGSLERAVRDAAQSLGRAVELRTSAGESRLDAHVLSKLGEALLHLVRNAVAHGIEPAAERAAAGKPSVGSIELAVERRAQRLVFLCRDDGRGIDLEAVRAAAVRRGLVPAASARALGLEDAVQLLLHGGVSTTATADATSGRGVGLDIVREADCASSRRGRAAQHRRRRHDGGVDGPHLPLRDDRAAGGGRRLTVSIPLPAVPRVLLAELRDIVRSERRASIQYQGQAIPLVLLWQALRQAQPARSGKHACIVLVQSGESLTAVLVDRLLGAAEVVVRPLPAMPADPIVVGASLDADGNPCLLLDPSRHRPRRAGGASDADRDLQPAAASSHRRRLAHHPDAGAEHPRVGWLRGGAGDLGRRGSGEGARAPLRAVPRRRRDAGN